MYRVALLTIGDELCIGQTTNTNAAWIAAELDALGAFLVEHSTIRDDKTSILEAFTRLTQRADLLIVTGGLGPTHDDITKDCLVEFFADELILHEKTLIAIQQLFFERNNTSLADLERNRAQAMLPAQCEVLANPAGTAPGMMFIKPKFTLISLPGVPKEMQAIMHAAVIPEVRAQIKQRKAPVILHKNLLTMGIAESALAEKIGSVDFLEQSSLAFLPTYGGVKLRIDVRAQTPDLGEKELKRIQSVLEEQVGQYMIADTAENIIELTHVFLTKSTLSVAVAESCTGGLLGGQLSALPGSAHFFKGGVIAYTNAVKSNVLAVDAQLISEHGAVSEAVAIAMAQGARALLNSDIAVSITGIAGPTGATLTKPVGLVYIGIATKDTQFAKRFVFSRERAINRELTVTNALYLLYQQCTLMN